MSQARTGSTTTERDGEVSWLRYMSASLSDQVRKLSFTMLSASAANRTGQGRAGQVGDWRSGADRKREALGW